MIGRLLIAILTTNHQPLALPHTFTVVQDDAFFLPPTVYGPSVLTTNL